jgi:quinol-cytochrome oxidoreductase complex cytochrome b subunit
VASWLYVFGVTTVAALIVIIASGLIIALKGPEWWHVTDAGRFFNAVHMWAAELFFCFMTVHLWAKYWMAAWRGGRIGLWATGALGFLVAVPTMLTGYVSQHNFDAQWISAHAKDALNSIGAGAFFNVMNFGQMYSYHVLLLPLTVVALAIAHVLLVRRHGMVPPLGLDERVDVAEAFAPPDVSPRAPVGSPGAGAGA